MFKKLKEKLTDGINKLTKETEKRIDEPEKENKEEEEKDSEEKKKPEKKVLGKIKDKITKKEISEEEFEDIFWELEKSLLENNVAVEVIEKIKNDLTEELTSKRITRTAVKETVENSLKKSLKEVLTTKSFDLEEDIEKKKRRTKNKEEDFEPYVIVFLGVNGSGKTTTLAKIAWRLQKKGLSTVLAASDTFRAASIDQLKKHADNLEAKMISHDYGSDPAAVAFDAVKHARANEKDVVLIDTAGRLHSDTNLMEELKKVIKVNNPDAKIFVGESVTGNDCIEQAKEFNNAVGIDATVLTKVDVDEKGGAALSISQVVQKPIIYIGTGQDYEDLKEFDKEEVIKKLGV